MTRLEEIRLRTIGKRLDGVSADTDRRYLLFVIDALLADLETIACMESDPCREVAVAALEKARA